jgi:hypothetical protein
MQKFITISFQIRKISNQCQIFSKNVTYLLLFYLALFET